MGFILWDLGYLKWKYRVEHKNPETGEKEHVHLEGNGNKYRQANDGTRRLKENLILVNLQNLKAYSGQ